MLSSKGPCNIWLPPCWKFAFPAVLLVTSFLLFQSAWFVAHRHSAIQSADSTPNVDKSHFESSLDHDNAGSNVTINLVMATLLQDDISWTERIGLPNLNVIRYVSDDMEAEYHPPIPNKGREALIYLTYLHDFYDNLPDITVFTHADESPWHMEDILNSSLVFAMSHLDLAEVQKRQYFNLRVSWENACPDWINTTEVEIDDIKQEQRYMSQAFNENFALNKVPEILAGPCCSQFAVTRDAVRRHPKSQYRISMDWLMETELEDFVSGRIWEHFWPWLFRGEAVDCPIEWKSYCKMYHICFDSESRNQLTKLEEEKKDLMLKTGIFQKVLDLFRGMKNKKRLAEIDAIISAELEKALERGKSEAVRTELLSDYYTS